MSIQKYRTKKNIVYAGAALVATVGIYQLVTTGLAASILTQILAIGLPILILGVVIGIPGFLLFQHIHYLATLEPDPKSYSPHEIEKFYVNRQEWLDGMIALATVNGISLVICFLIGFQNPVMAIGIFVVVFIISVASKHVVKYPIPKELQLRTRNIGNYGKGGWAFWEEISKGNLYAQHSDDYLKAIIFGEDINPYIPIDHESDKWSAAPHENTGFLTYCGESNAITFAQTRAGKGTTAIIPTLLISDESAFVMDVKGENFFVTFLQRLLSGHRIIKINPFNLFGQEIADSDHFTDRFNPLHNLKPDSPKFVSNIMKLSSAMVVSDGKDEHFSSRGRDLVTLLIGHICSDPTELAAGNNNLPRVAEILGMHPKQFSEFMEEVALNPLPFIRNTALTFASPDSREIESVRATISTQLGFLNDPQIAYFLSGHTFDFEDLRKELTTIYCMFPMEELKTQYRFARLIVQSLFNALMTSPKHDDGRVLILLDEQAQLGNMQVLRDAPAIMTGYKVRIWSIFQDIPQIKAIYKEGWETLLSNSGIVEFLQPNDPITCEHISKWAGDGSISETTITISRGTRLDENGREVPTETRQEGEKVFGRSFLSPQDLYQMPSDRAILISPAIGYPVMIRPRKYYEQDHNQPYIGDYQATEKRYFIGQYLFAPHPVHDRYAFAWMRNFYNEIATAKATDEENAG
jgi:type IV secretory pathway TraG/TraD family ATPase VirD4